jgi:hypothetical protein
MVTPPAENESLNQPKLRARLQANPAKLFREAA